MKYKYINNLSCEHMSDYILDTETKCRYHPYELRYITNQLNELNNLYMNTLKKNMELERELDMFKDLLKEGANHYMHKSFEAFWLEKAKELERNASFKIVE